MVTVVRHKFENGELESIESLLARFKRAVKENGDLEIIQDRRYFKPRSVAAREKHTRALIRYRKEHKYDI